MEGFLWKKGKIRGSYKRRHFSLRGMILSYSDGGKSKGTIELQQVLQLRLASDPTKHTKAGPWYSYALELETPKRVWVLIPESLADQERWIDALVAVLNPHSVASDVAAGAQARKRAAEEASRPRGRKGGKGGRESKRRAPSVESDSDAEDDGRYRPPRLGAGAGRMDSDDDIPGGTGATSPAKSKRGLFGRSKKSDIELTSQAERAYKTKITKLEQENRKLQQALKSGSPKSGQRRAGKKGSLQQGLLDDDDDEYDSDEEADGCCAKFCRCIKKNLAMFVLLLVNLVLLALGCALLASAAWAYEKLKNIVPLDGILLCLSIGSALLIMSIMGLVGAFKRSKRVGRCFLYLFVIIMSLLVVVELAAGVMIYKNADIRNVKGSLGRHINNGLNDVMWDCCPAVLGTVPGTRPECSWIPSSILNKVDCDGCTGKGTKTNPCGNLPEFKDQIASFLKPKFKLLGGICIGIIVLQLMSIISCVFLAKDGRRLAKQYKRSHQWSDSDSEDDRRSRKKAAKKKSKKKPPPKKKKKSRRRGDSSDYSV